MPATGSWRLLNKQGVPCLLAMMAVQLNLTRSDLPFYAQMPKANYFLVNVPPTAMATGHCQENGTSLLELSWDDDQYHFICSFQFKSIHKPAGKPVSEWKMDQLNVITSLKENVAKAKSSESIDLHVQAHALSIAMTGFSYQTFICTEGYEFQFQSYNGKNNNGSISMSHIKLQPFDVTNGQFSFKVFHCPSTEESSSKQVHQNIAPLIVGGVLAIITVLILIGYIITFVLIKINDKKQYETVNDI